MVGTIRKTEKGWMMEYKVDEKTPIGHKSWWENLPLHPDDVRQINDDAKVFDNIEARITAYPDVEFDIVNMGFGPDDNILTYAKLKQPKKD